MTKRFKNLIPALFLFFSFILPDVAYAEKTSDAFDSPSSTTTEVTENEASDDTSQETVESVPLHNANTEDEASNKEVEEEADAQEDTSIAEELLVDEESTDAEETEAVEEDVEEASDDETNSDVNSQELTDEEKEAIKDNADSLVPDQDKEGMVDENGQEERQVRVVIELDGTTLIEEATRQGVSVSQLDDATIHTFTSNLLAQQADLKNVLEINGIELSTYSENDELAAGEQFTVTVNAFVTYVKESDIGAIRATPGVSNVYEAIEYERPQYTVDMTSSNDMINQGIAEELGYKGEGQVIAVIDSGYDPTHPDLQNLTDSERAALTKQMVDSLGLPGVYVNEKVPYAYNYYDLNNNYKDIGESGHHGQHVAGTVGANGFIKGVAPESQILGMKVFSDDIQYATTFSDVYLRAIEDAILLGADVINMSLGSPAGFYVPGSIEDVAINKALDNGIIVAISGGNENNIMDGVEYFAGYLVYGLPYPYVKNPDVGVVGSPSLNEGSISVASVENTHVMADKMEFTVDGEEGATAMQVAAGSPFPTTVFDGPQEIVHIGANSATPGVAADWEGQDVRGKIALVQRGNTFTDTLANAQAAGAAGLIVYNHADGGEGLINMAGGDSATIPFVFIGNDVGKALVNANHGTVTFTDEQIQSENPSGWKMSDFSSWGTTPDLRMKPEITAPGGQIYSLQNDGEYSTMSGTSMAAPHVAGGAALVQQRLKQDEIFDQLNLTDRERAELTKALLMNTADILFDEDGFPYLVRQQGAGLMDLKGALTTDVVVVESNSKNAKVELGSIASKSFNFSLDFLNLSNETRYYRVNSHFLKDYIEQYAPGLEFSLLASDYLNARISAVNGVEVVSTNGQDESIIIEVAPNSKGNPARYVFTVDFSKDGIAWNNFVEGFLTFNPLAYNEAGELVVADKYAALGMPLLGFYGNWDEPKVTDELRENALDSDLSKHPTFTLTTPVQYDEETGTLYFANAYEENYMNPGSDLALNKESSTFGFMATMLRNAEQVNFRIVDAQGQVLRNLQSYYNQRKITRMTRGQAPYTFFANALWDGMIDGRPLADGEVVYYEVEFLRTLNSDPQRFRFTIVGDNTAPTVENLSVVKADGKVYLDFSSIDTGSGGQGFTVAQVLGDGSIDEVIFTGERTDFFIDVTSLLNKDGETSLMLLGYDKVGNAIVEYIDIQAFVDESVAVAAPVVDEVAAHHQNVSGTTDAGNNVTVTLKDGTVLGSAVANEAGQFIVEVEPQAAGTTLFVTAENTRGYVSEATEVVVDEAPASQDVSIIADIDGWPLSIAPEDKQFDFGAVNVIATSEDGKHVVTAVNSRDYVKSFENLYVGNYFVTAAGLPEGFQLLEPLFLTITEDLITRPFTLQFEIIEELIREPDENTQAQIVLNSPDLLAAYDTNEINIAGLVYGLDDISHFYAGNQEITLTPVDNYSVIIGGVEVFYGRVYTFDETITVEDGYHEMPFRVSNGNPEEDFSIARRFWVDTEAPEFDAVGPRIRRLDNEYVHVDFDLSDNLSVLHLTRDGNYVTEWDETSNGFGSTNIQKTYTDRVKLAPGKNVLTYTLSDIAGNITTYEIVVHYVETGTPVSDVYEPEAGEITVDLNESSDLPDAESVITNSADLPEGTSYAYENAEDVDLSGETTDAQTVTVVVTYADGSEDRVDVSVVVIPLTLANQNEPEADEVKVDLNESSDLPDAESVITNSADLPEGTSYAYENADEVDLSGETTDAQTVTVVVTYADGSEDRVKVPVVVIPLTLANQNEPEANEVSVDLNEVSELPDASATISNRDELPEGTTYAYENAEDVDLSGETTDVQAVTVVVTYADGSEDRVDVSVVVTPLTLANQNEPEADEVKVDLNESSELPDASATISNRDELPEGTTYAYENAEDVDLSGETTDAQAVTVVINYADGSEDRVEVSVVVTPLTLANQNEPEADEVKVDLNESSELPDASATISNRDELPEGTTYAYENAEDVDLSGETTDAQAVTVVITYADGSEDRVEVAVTVTPTTPVEPAKPGKPTEPEKPEKTEKVETEKQPEKGLSLVPKASAAGKGSDSSSSEKALPAAGEATNYMMYIGLAFIATGAIIRIKDKRKRA